MKILIVLLTTCLMQVSAASFAQKITYSKKAASLEQIFAAIAQQTGYNIFYSARQVSSAKKMDVNFQNTELKDVLNILANDQHLAYTIDDQNISVTLKAPTFLERLAERWAAIDVSGRVVDADGRGLPGASVTVKGKGGKAVSTGANGSFYLKGVDENAVLIVSFIGYLPKEIKAVANLGDVVLELSTSKLDEVQVIAYGTTTQRLSTGNVTTIKADVIEKQPVNNPLLALQGRVPGLFIEQATGFAGTGVKVRIQGQNSMFKGNDPLYVIDGIPFTSQLLPGGNPIVGNSGETDLAGNFVSSNPLNFISPSEIESIDVLKDADATAIYGSRAANGAILITTKKGKVGEVKVNANVQYGIGEVGRKLELLSTEQYLEMRMEALKNDGILSYGVNDYDLNGTWNKSRNADWQKELIGGNAKYTDIQASISGGSNDMNFLIGAGYHKEGNVFPGDFGDTKNSIHFSINVASPNQKFKAQFSGSYLQDYNLLPQIDLTGSAINLAPNAPELYTKEGEINWQFNSLGRTTFYRNPIALLGNNYKNKVNNLIGNAVLSYQVFQGLVLKSSFGYTALQSNVISSSFLSVKPPELQMFGSRNTNFSDSKIDSWSIEPQLTYNRKISKGHLEVLLGSTIQKEGRDMSSINASGFNSDQVVEDIKSAKTLTAGYAENSLYRYNAIFARVNYNWQDKYLLNLTARRDGSSRFGPENQFHNFGAVGTAWVFSEEQFFKNLSFLSFGKLRGSYGTTGNDRIGDYKFLSLYDALPYEVPYQGAIGYQPNGLTNPYLQWEETKKLQFGLDIGFLKDRILLNTNYSLNRSSNQLLIDALPTTTGFTAIAKNFPAKVQNTGWEFMLNSINLTNTALKWSSGFNITLPKNKLLAYPGYPFNPGSGYQIGKPLSIVYLYRYLGVDPATGVFQFADSYGNPTSSPIPEVDNNIIRSTDPKYYGGLQNTLIYKGFQLDFLFSFVKQIAQNYYFGYGQPGQFQLGTMNQPSWIVDRWQKPGDSVSQQRYSTGTDLSTSINYAQNSDTGWSDASYIRLKNVSLSWKLPDSMLKQMHIQTCRFYLQGQNLFTITNYFGLDPETKNSSSLPPLRVLTMGIQMGF